MGLHNKEKAVEVGLGEVRRIDELQRQLWEDEAETLAEGEVKQRTDRCKHTHIVH